MNVADDYESGSGALNLPPSEPVQNRMERTAAYTTTTEDLAKWDHIVKHNREVGVHLHKIVRTSDDSHELMLVLMAWHD